MLISLMQVVQVFILVNNILFVKMCYCYTSVYSACNNFSLFFGIFGKSKCINTIGITVIVITARHTTTRIYFLQLFNPSNRSSICCIPYAVYIRHIALREHISANLLSSQRWRGFSSRPGRLSSAQDSL